MITTNHFTDRETGQVIRVEKVSEHYASITVVSKLVSTYSMPTAIYDTEFVSRYKPLDIGDVKVPGQFRPPANAHLWDEGLVEAPPVLVGVDVAVPVPPAPEPAPVTTVMPGEDESDDGAEVANYGYAQPLVGTLRWPPKDA